MLKNVITFALAAAFCIGPCSTPSANPSPDKIENPKWHSTQGWEGILFEDTCSYNEMLLSLARNGFTPENLMGEHPAGTESTSIRYVLFKLDIFTYKRQYQLQPAVWAELEYSAGCSSPNKIVSLQNPHILTENCAFSGEIFMELYHGGAFYYDFRGTLYKNGKTTWEPTKTAGIGDSLDAKAILSGESSTVCTVSDSGNYYSAALEE